MSEMKAPQDLTGVAHEALLDVLARAQVAPLKALAEELLAPLGEVEVLASQTGLVMLPMRDTAQGTAFHLGEVLVAEAHIEGGGQEGYGMRRGRDLEAAMAMALVDLAVARGLAHPAISAFYEAEAARQRTEDEARLCEIEATRVDMETF